MLRCSEITIYRYLRQGRLKSSQPGGKRGRHLISSDSIFEMVSSKKDISETNSNRDNLEASHDVGSKPDTIRVILKRDVLSVLAKKFKTTKGQRNLSEGRLHLFRHFFCSQCAAQGVPEQVLMEWLPGKEVIWNWLIGTLVAH